MMKQSEKMRKSFKNLISLSLLATILVLAASCKKEDFNDDPDVIGVERNINTSAGLPQNNDKAFLDYNDALKVKWNDGDAININGTSLVAAAIYNNEDNPRATFYGTVHALKEATNNNDVYWAVYPATLVGTYSGGIPAEFTTSTLTYTLPATQNFNSTLRPLQDSTYMAGRTSVADGTEHLSFQMRNLGAVMKLHLTAAAGVAETRVSKIVFSSTSNHLSGKFTIDANDDISEGNGTGCLTVNLSDGRNQYIDISGNGADVYVFLPPIAQGGSLAMRVYNVDGDVMLKYTTNAKVERNKLYTDELSVTSFSAPDPAITASSDNGKVIFAPGNLQYQPSTGTLRFAQHQYDFVGDDATGTVYENNTKCNNSLITPTYTGWIDLFGWGTSGWNNGNTYFMPYNSEKYPSEENALKGYGYGPTDGSSYTFDLAGTYANSDWGVYNRATLNATLPLAQRGNWRTPSREEYDKILVSRSTISNIRYAKAIVNNVNGLLILPDSWCECIYPLNNTNTYNARFNTNVISLSDWTNILEPQGVVFLPASGGRDGLQINNSSVFGDYWTVSAYANSKFAYVMVFWNENLDIVEYWRYTGYSIRLVRDVQ